MLHFPFSQIVIIGTKANPRVNSFQNSLSELGLAQAFFVPYIELLDGRVSLDEALTQDTLVRLESPGKDFELESRILQLGAEKSASETFEFFDNNKMANMEFDKGRILAPRQWYLGFSLLLNRIAEEAKQAKNCRFMNHPDDIALMFDKPACQSLFMANQIDVPQQLGLVGSFQDLDEKMRQQECSSVFVKLAHGSSASGMIAYRRHKLAEQAYTTVELVDDEAGLRLYNTRRVRKLNNAKEIRILIDAICRHRAFAEMWLPKATHQSMSCDLRVLTIAEKPQHVVLRKSKGPFTNLHLLNERADADELKQRMLPANWQAAMQSCARAAGCFPRSLYAGIDLLILSGLRSHAIAEINAFGDQLNGVVQDGKDTYTCQLESLMPANILEGALCS